MVTSIMVLVNDGRSPRALTTNKEKVNNKKIAVRMTMPCQKDASKKVMGSNRGAD